jgi:hypothetical protein
MDARDESNRRKRNIMGDNATDEIRVYGWTEGDQVWHTGWKSVGTVRIVHYDPSEYEEAGCTHLGTVAWHGTCVTDELHEDMAEELEPYTGQDGK